MPHVAHTICYVLRHFGSKLFINMYVFIYCMAHKEIRNPQISVTTTNVQQDNCTPLSLFVGSCGAMSFEYVPYNVHIGFLATQMRPVGPVTAGVQLVGCHKTCKVNYDGRPETGGKASVIYLGEKDLSRAHTV